MTKDKSLGVELILSEDALKILADQRARVVVMPTGEIVLLTLTRDRVKSLKMFKEFVSRCEICPDQEPY